MTLGLVLGCAGLFGEESGEETAVGAPDAEADADTDTDTDADADADTDTDTGEALDPRCKVVLPANTWVQVDWNDATIRSDMAVWVCDSDASATVGGDNNVMVLSGNAQGSLQGDDNTIYAVGSEGYYSFSGGEGNTLVTDGEPEGFGEDSEVNCPWIEIDFSQVPEPCPEAVE